MYITFIKFINITFITFITFINLCFNNLLETDFLKKCAASAEIFPKFPRKICKNRKMADFWRFCKNRKNWLKNSIFVISRVFWPFFPVFFCPIL